MTSSQTFAGLALIGGLAVGCQVLAARLRVPAIILLLPAGFAVGAVTMVVNAEEIFGAAFSPLVSLAVAVILFDGGLDLVTKGLVGDSRWVVRRLRGWATAGFCLPALFAPAHGAAAPRQAGEISSPRERP